MRVQALINLNVTYNKIKNIYDKEGIVSILKRGLSKYRLFEYGTHYLYEHNVESILQRKRATENLIRVEDCALEIVSTREQADRLASQGNDIRSLTRNAYHSLDRGGVAFCILTRGKLASICWITSTEEARKYLSPLPYHVDFNKEVWAGAVLTTPEHQGKGLLVYTAYIIYRFLKEHGILIVRTDVAEFNSPSHRAHVIIGATVYARFRYLKILWWQYWKETPVSSVPRVKSKRKRKRQRVSSSPPSSAPL